MVIMDRNLILELEMMMLKLNAKYRKTGIIPSSTIIKKVGECNGISSFRVIADIIYKPEEDKFIYKLREGV